MATYTLYFKFYNRRAIQLTMVVTVSKVLSFLQHTMKCKQSPVTFIHSVNKECAYNKNTHHLIPVLLAVTSPQTWPCRPCVMPHKKSAHPPASIQLQVGLSSRCGHSLYTSHTSSPCIHPEGGELPLENEPFCWCREQGVLLTKHAVSPALCQPPTVLRNSSSSQQRLQQQHAAVQARHASSDRPWR